MSWYFVTFRVISLYSPFIPYSFSFIFIRFRSSLHSFLFSVRSPVSDSYVLVLVPSGLSSYVSVLIHVMRPSPGPFRMPFVRDRYIVASLFRICTPSRFTLP